jgi:hypothetical protein
MFEFSTTNKDQEEPLLEKSSKLIPVRRATVPSPRSPSFSLFPSPPSSHGGTTPNPIRGASLQRSVTGPSTSPARPQFAKHLYPQRQDSHVYTYTPSQGSGTPASDSYDWQSDASPASTEASEEDSFDRTISKPTNVVIHLSEPDSEQKLSQDKPEGSIPKSTDIMVAAERIKSHTNLQSKFSPDKVKTQPPKSPISRGLSLQHKALPSPAMRRKQSLPTQVRPQLINIGPASQPQSNFKQLSAPPPPNPLKSSPASPGEISIARQLSLSRRQQMLVPIVPKTARQPQQATLVTPLEESNKTAEQSRQGSSNNGHIRGKSEHVVLDSV